MTDRAGVGASAPELAGGRAEDERESTISVVIPTRDRPRELARALSAARAQRDVDLDVVVVDDGSELPATVPSDDEAVRVLRVDASRGVAAARNRGIAAARGTWIAFLDDDDIWAPERCRLLLEAAEVDAVAVVASGTVKLDPRGRALAVRASPSPATVQRELRWRNALGEPSAVMVRRELLERVGGFDESLSVLADWDLWIRLVASARVAVCPQVLSGYVVHSGSMHVRHTDDALTEFQELGRRYGRARHRNDEGMHDEILTRWAGSAYRAGGHRLKAARMFWRSWRRYRWRADLLQVAGALLGGRVPPIVPAWRTTVPPPEWVALYQDRPGALLRPMARPAAVDVPGGARYG